MKRSSRTWVALALFVLPCSMASVARAAEPDAAQSFRAGAAAYAKGDFRAAAEDFERAYQLSPHGSPAYNAGLAWESANEPARAADAYQLALDTHGLTSAQAADAYGRLAVLEKKLARLEVVGPSGASLSIEHVQNAPLPRKLHLPPGSHELRATRGDGRTTSQTIEVKAGESQRIDLAASAPAPAPAAPPKVEAAPAASEPNEAPSEHHGSGRKILGLVAIGGGVALAGVGTYFGVRALDARDQFDASGHTSQDLHDRASSQRLAANVMFASAVVLGGTGVVLFLTAPKSDAKPASSASSSRVELTGTGARFSLRF